MDINADRKRGTGMSWEHCAQKPKNNHAFLSRVTNSICQESVDIATHRSHTAEGVCW